MQTCFDQLVRAASGVKLGEPARPLPEMGAQAAALQRRATLRRALTRYSEGLRMYRPLPHLAEVHSSTAKWRIIDGSNRSSKTMTGAAEACRAWLGADPFDKYPRRNGNSLVVGLQLDHIAMIWRKCADQGAFKLIPDEQTGLPRAVRPDPNDPLHLDPYDLAYREKWRDAPPLIPKRMIATLAWEDRSKGQPRFVRFTTGWTVLFRSSDSKAPQGDHYNFGWLDEEIINEGFIAELKRGMVGLDELPKHRPKSIWTATAQTTNPELLEFREQADAGAEHTRAFQALIKDCPYVPDEEKQAFHDSLSEDDRKVRYYGEYAIMGRRCYPTYDPQDVHGYDPFEVPPDWCRYIGLDPGTMHCGTIFIAIDPEEKYIWLYGGFDLRNSDAVAWAERVRQRNEQYEAVVCDYQMGKTRHGGATLTVARQYSEALEDAGVKVRQQGPMAGFFEGTPDIPAREEALRGWMALRRDGPFAGTAKLKVARGVIPELDKQIRHAHMDRRAEEKRARLDHDLLEGLEYLAGLGPRYHEPVQIKPTEDEEVFRQFQEHQRRQLRRRRTTASCYGSLTGLGG